MRARSFRLPGAALAFAVIAACSQSESAVPGGASTSTTAGSNECAKSDNDAIRLALQPTCQACHGEGSAKPFFKSLEAFESLLVYNPDYIKPGKPDESRLVQLLVGGAKGAYAQMPIGGEPFAARAAAGKTKIKMDEIRAWITTLTGPDPSTATASVDALTIRRLRTDELSRAMQRAMGFPEEGASQASKGSFNVWVRDPDMPPGTDYNSTSGLQNWSIMGGRSALARIKGDDSMSPSTLRTVVQMSLDWCGQAVTKNAKVMFRDATVTDTSTAAPEKIRANIAYLHLRFLGAVAAPADVDGLYSGVFLPAEPRGGAVAWTEVCAALVRDPRFLTF